MKPITIIGGGLAGLTLGILLRRENIPVIIHEAGSYPRHRVCGEFLSGNGRAILEDLNLGPKLQQCGATEGGRCAFFIPGRRSIDFRLPERALCLSRFEMDALLANEFESSGGHLNLNSRWSGDISEGVILATGRRRSETGHGHLFGLKAHATGAQMTSDLEIHFSRGRYVGICGLGSDKVNVCGLFYSPEAVPDIRHQWRELLAESIPSLKKATFLDDSFCAVAGITLDSKSPANTFKVGDAAAMIPPLTGNGMSMALESAQLASTPLQSYSRGAISWTEAVSRYMRAWNSRFVARLRWANFTQRLVFHTASQRIFYAIARIVPRTPALFFARTR